MHYSALALSFTVRRPFLPVVGPNDLIRSLSGSAELWGSVPHAVRPPSDQPLSTRPPHMSLVGKWIYIKQSIYACLSIGAQAWSGILPGLRTVDRMVAYSLLRFGDWHETPLQDSRAGRLSSSISTHISYYIYTDAHLLTKAQFYWTTPLDGPVSDSVDQRAENSPHSASWFYTHCGRERKKTKSVWFPH